MELDHNIYNTLYIMSSWIDLSTWVKYWAMYSVDQQLFSLYVLFVDFRKTLWAKEGFFQIQSNRHL